MYLENGMTDIQKFLMEPSNGLEKKSHMTIISRCRKSI